MTFPAQIEGLEQAAQLPARPLHLAVGMFDGVHLGHRTVIDAAIQSARRSGGLAGVLTFWPHPSQLFRPEDPVRLIQSAAIKTRMLLALGIDVVITQPFTPEFAATEAAEFLPRLRRALHGLTTLYVGENWRFGRGRKGDIQFLIAEARKQGLTIFSAPRINENGEPISSTRIRNALEAGRIEEANMMLGYSYFAEGRVAPGKRLGRTLGFPTLNLPWNPDLRPRFGVYAVRVYGKESSPGLPAVANYGVRPTVEQTNMPQLETHLLEACPYGEGDALRVEWLRFLRPEKRFHGIEELRAQIAQDRTAAAALFLDDIREPSK
ncbi:MAG TPA: riboflavin biosynthesis protein RibF [Opitutaceae bacterium]